jgi:hypothetical protein
MMVWLGGAVSIVLLVDAVALQGVSCSKHEVAEEGLFEAPSFPLVECLVVWRMSCIAFRWRRLAH